MGLRINIFDLAGMGLKTVVFYSDEGATCCFNKSDHCLLLKFETTWLMDIKGVLAMKTYNDFKTTAWENSSVITVKYREYNKRN